MTNYMPISTSRGAAKQRIGENHPALKRGEWKAEHVSARPSIF